MSDLSGKWELEVQFIRGQAQHTVDLQQDGEALSGRYATQYDEREVRGTVRGEAVELHTHLGYQHVGAHYVFRGQVDGDAMSGTVGLGEYWSGTWTARRVG